MFDLSMRVIRRCAQVSGPPRVAESRWFRALGRQTLTSIQEFFMRAVLSKSPGGPETLVVEEVLDPTPMKGEVIIEVKAVGTNFPTP